MLFFFPLTALMILSVSELLMDVPIASPVPGPSTKHKLTRAEALLDMRAASKACQRKQAKYTV